MNQIITQGIVLTRTNYQEADRILTLLTPDNGKLRLLAKGVRKSRSKMAGGIELFSLAEIGFIRGKGELCTLTTSRLKHHYQHIVDDINRTMLGYDLMKLLNKSTEDEPGPEYFDLLRNTLQALDDATTSQDVVKLWFYGQLLKLGGHSPNLQTDTQGKKLIATEHYLFSYDDMAFTLHPNGSFRAEHIKLLRLVSQGNKPAVLQKVSGIERLLDPCLQLIQTILGRCIHV